MTTEWASAIKAADPLGFHDKSSPQEVEAGALLPPVLARAKVPVAPMTDSLPPVSCTGP